MIIGIEDYFPMYNNDFHNQLGWQIEEEYVLNQRWEGAMMLGTVFVKWDAMYQRFTAIIMLFMARLNTTYLFLAQNEDSSLI